MHSHVKTQSSWLVVLDLVWLLISIFLAVMLRFGHDEITEHVFGRLDGWTLFIGSILIANFMGGSYRVQYTLSRFNLLVTWLFSMAVAIFILSITSYAWFRILLGRGVLALAVVLYSTFSLYLRVVVFRAVFSAGCFVKRVAVLGYGPGERRLRDYIENPFVLPQHRVVSWLVLHESGRRLPARKGQVLDGVPVVDAELAELTDALQNLKVDMLVLGKEAMYELSALYSMLHRIRFSGIEVLTPLSVSEIYCGRIPIDLIDEGPAMRAGIEAGLPLISGMKRVMDLGITLLVAPLLLLLALLIALVIKLSDPCNPVLYSQRRTGQFGRVFTIRKFRTMRPDAESISGAVWSAMDDERVTRVGRVLRTFRLDEIPQFWNILRGEMSLVGPRPERPEIVQMLEKKIPFYGEREYAVPGLSGWAQIHCPYGNSIEATRRKLEYDLYYVKNMSPSLDLQIILRTLRIVIFGKEKRG